MKEIRRKLMALMKKHQMGITEFAEKCGMEEGRLERILHSRGRLTPAEAVKIAAAFGQTMEEAFDIEPLPMDEVREMENTEFHKMVTEHLNTIATFTKGTVEFRLFQFDAPADGKLNGLHAGQLKSYIQLCLALSQMAKEVRTASPKPQQTENPKYAMRTWLLRLGFIGDEFKTARDILTKRLAGDTAFRSGRAA